MGIPGRLIGRLPVARFVMLLAAFWPLSVFSITAAEPVMAEFPALSGGQACRSALVPLPDSPMLVTVVPPGSNPLRPAVISGAPQGGLRVIGHDPVSRLAFLESGEAAAGSARSWRPEAGGCVGTTVKALAATGPVDGRVTGWVKQVNGKILPLALLQVDFASQVPPPGTPLVDARNHNAAIIFQAAGNGRTAYAIPAEAVHRVRRDICSGGILVRCQLGLTLDAQNPAARVVRVLPDSPAAAAGIRPADVLLQVGNRRIGGYADVPDAFFYLIPGQPAAIVVQRESRRIELNITPASGR